MKKLFLALTLLCALTNVSQAQSKSSATATAATPVAVSVANTASGTEEAAAAETKLMTRQLKLTSDQEAQIYKVNQAFAERTKFIASNPKGVDTRAMDEIAKNKDQQYQAILSPEQYKRWITAVKK